MTPIRDAEAAIEVDPRVDDSYRATDREIDEGYLGQMRDDVTVTHGPEDAEKQISSSSDYPTKDETIYVEFEEDDPRNPFNFSRRYVIFLPMQTIQF
jgi:hypothetical protein